MSERPSASFQPDDETGSFMDCLAASTALQGPGAGRGYGAVLVLRIDAFDKYVILGRIRQSRSVIRGLKARLAAGLREGDAVFVIGDRDLGILLPRLENQAMLKLAANKILHIANTCRQEPDFGLMLKAHLGACLFGQDSPRSPETLFQRAYLAMLEAERKNQALVVFREEHSQTLCKEVEIEAALNRAVEHFDDFELVYQPQLILASNTVAGAEVLIRWNDQRLGFVPPNLFIPIAERMGLIDQITAWVVHKALNFLNELSPMAPEFGFSINLSPLNLLDPGFPRFVEEALALWHLAPSRLTLELTEGAMMENPEQALSQLEKLKRIGVGLSVDDFGTGYSSLQYLRRLPIDEVKIDRAFIFDLRASDQDKAIVDTVVSLARNFKLVTVAEGVEDGETLEYLSEIGCLRAQGYCISRPLTETKLVEFIERHR